MSVGYLRGPGRAVCITRGAGRSLLYAVLSLTVVRMLPVALALLGTAFDRLHRRLQWSVGPRGLASVVFTLLAFEGLHGAGADAVAVISLTVRPSVLAHGFSAVPAANRFAATRPTPVSPKPDQASGHAVG